MKEVNPVETFFKRVVVKENTSQLCQGALETSPFRFPIYKRFERCAVKQNRLLAAEGRYPGSEQCWCIVSRSLLNQTRTHTHERTNTHTHTQV